MKGLSPFLPAASIAGFSIAQKKPLVKQIKAYVKSAVIRFLVLL
jgi:hypothetical protein